MAKPRWPKGLEAEFLRMTEMALQHPKEVEEAIMDGHRLWVEELKTREAWVKDLPETYAYQVLLFLLYAAQEEKVDPILQQVFAVCAMIEFLTESNFPSALVRPLRDLRGDLLDLQASKRLKGKPGARPMPHNEAVAATVAAAAVTALSKKMGVKAALKLISKAARIDEAWLGQFRKNLQRGIGNHAFNYRTMILTFDGKSAEQVLGLYPSAT